MKKNLFLLVCLLSISLVAVAQEKSGGTYIQNPGNEKFEGTYVFDDGQQRLVMTLKNRERVRVVDSHIITDVLEGNISYIKNGKTIMAKTVGASHIQGGMAQKDNPNVVIANFADSERGQGGDIALTLNPQDNIAVFTVKKREAVYVITDEASRQRVKQQQEWYRRPFAIPDSLVLKKQR